ncbi:MAG: cache domain-containing protein [Bacteroidales bacterium]|nr:cache domain-containing protein [Bacteroidales bacterium]
MNPVKSTSKARMKNRAALFLWLAAFAVTSGCGTKANLTDTKHTTPSAEYKALPKDQPVTDSDYPDLFFEIDARAVVGVSAALVEGYLSHALTALRLIAAAPATRSGIWPEIRPKLQTLCEAIPGAALFIEPEGSYYSVEQGYTGLNLADRAYFEPLFAGKEIHGALIYSRSTGKKSVLIAVPAMENGEVTGAVALSVFLDDFQKMVSESLNLPDNYLWYVLSEDGNTVLHPRSDFVFMKPAEQGSPSMAGAVQTILSQDEGYTSYSFSGRKTHILYKKTGFNNWRMILGKIGEQIEEDYMPEAYQILNKLKQSIETELRNMDNNLDALIASFNGRIPPERVARNGFRSLYRDNPYVISCTLIDTDGNLVYIEPPEFYTSEGLDIRDQESFFMMQKNRAPMLSNSFIAVEGFDAISLLHPITDEMGEYHGSVSLLIRPEVMIQELATPIIAETIYQPLIMETDGRIIFDKAFEGTGRMLFLDPAFAEMRNLLELGEIITANKSGHGDYIFTDATSGEKMVNLAVWDTVTLHGAKWRLVISYTPY